MTGTSRDRKRRGNAEKARLSGILDNKEGTTQTSPKERQGRAKEGGTDVFALIPRPNQP